MDNLAYKEPPRVELIEGKTCLMSPRPKLMHNRICVRIAHIFESYLERKRCVALGDGADVYLDDKNHYVPDAMIVCNRSILHEDAVYGAPDLVVEVLSPSTAKNDRGPKMRMTAGLTSTLSIPIFLTMTSNAWTTMTARMSAWRFPCRFTRIFSSRSETFS